MLLNFQDKTFTSDGRTSANIFARSGHPCMSLLDYDKDPRAVFQLALVQEGSEEDAPSDHSSDNELEGYYDGRVQRRRTWTKLMKLSW